MSNVLLSNVLLGVLGAGAVIGGIARYVEARKQGEVTWIVWGMLITGLFILLYSLALFIQKLT